MAKPVINYKEHMTENSSDRNQVKTLEEVVYHAIDRGLIAGLKPSAARSIADMWGQRNPCKTGVCARSIGLKHADSRLVPCPLTVLEKWRRFNIEEGAFQLKEDAIVLRSVAISPWPTDGANATDGRGRHDRQAEFRRPTVGGSRFDA